MCIGAIMCIFSPISYLWSYSANQVDSLNDIAWEISLKQPTKAIELILEAIDLAKKNQYNIGLAKSYGSLGVFYSDLGLLSESEIEHLKALEINEKLDDIKGIIYNYKCLSFLKVLQGNYEKAIEYGYQAVDKLEKYPEEKALLVQVYLNIGIAHKDNENYIEARRFYEESLLLAKELKDTMNIAGVYYNLGQLYEQQNHLDSSKIDFLNALSLALDGNLQFYATKTYSALGSIDLKLKNEAIARTWFEKSMAISFTQKDSLTLFYDYHGLSQLAMQESKIDSALQFCQLADSMLINCGGMIEQELLMKQFETIYAEKGFYNQAYLYKNQAVVLKDSMFNIEKSKQIANIETKYQTEKLKRENVEVQGRMNMALGGVAFLSSLMIGGYIFYRNRQKALKTINAQQVELNEKQVELHENEIEDLLTKQEIAFIGAKLDGREIERQAFYEELHHNIGNKMLTVKWKYDNAVLQLKEQNIDTQEIDAANEMLKDTYQEIRTIHDRVGAGNVKRIGIKAAVQDMTQTISNTGSMEVAFLPYGDFNVLNTKLEVTLYRIIQELMSNIMKYSEATEVEIALNQRTDVVNLMVSDNGKGFDLSSKSSGSGLLDIQNRVQQFEGSFDIDSGQGVGTTVIINMPLDNE